MVMATTTSKSKVVPAVASISVVMEIKCCSGTYTAIDEKTAEVVAESGGRELHKVACVACGSEYMIGVIARTREESLADEAFEQVGDEELEQLGVDSKDLGDGAADDDVKMCARCDGSAALRDLCVGCREYVHLECRTRAATISGRHHAEYHWQEPGARAEHASGGFVAEEGGGEVSQFDASDDGSGPDDEPDYAR